MALPTASDNKFTKVIIQEAANDGSDFSNPAADYRVLFLGEDGLLHLRDSAGTVTTPAQGGLVDPMTTRGDGIVRNSSNVTARLAVGSANTYYGSDGTDPSWSAVTDAKLSTSDITTNNASTTKHGFAPKYPNDATKYLDGTGAYTVPAGGGGGLAQSFTGYNTVGATWTATVANREWAKPITLAATSHFRSIDLHIRPNQDSTGGGLRAGLVTDIGGVPGLLIAEGTATGNQLFSGATSGFPGTGRWFSIAIGPTVAAGNYWIVWEFTSIVLDIANDTSGGGDVRWDLGFDGFSGGHTALTQTTTAIRHSVRASILS